MSLLSGFITAIFYNWHMNKVIIIIIIIMVQNGLWSRQISFDISPRDFCLPFAQTVKEFASPSKR